MCLIFVSCLHSRLVCDFRDIVFAWVPGHAGIRGISVVDLAAMAAKCAMEKPVNKRLALPYSDFMVLTNIYIYKEACGKLSGKDIQRISCIRLNPKWMIPLRRIVDVTVRKPYYADCILVTHFKLSFIY